MACHLLCTLTNVVIVLYSKGSKILSAKKLEPGIVKACTTLSVARKTVDFNFKPTNAHVQTISRWCTLGQCQYQPDIN